DNATEYKFKSDDVAAATGLTYVSTDGDFIFTAAPTAVPASCRVAGYYYVEILNAYFPSWFTLTLTENTDGSFTGAWN
ncbi:MAG: hypothetical protein RR216_06290, partial [Pseudoflavonifractor sp.]